MPIKLYQIIGSLLLLVITIYTGILIQNDLWIFPFITAHLNISVILYNNKYE